MTKKCKNTTIEITPKKKSIFLRVLDICPYTHLFSVIKTAAKERKFPNAAAKQGAIIMLLGICCPIFWLALINGASVEELRFHATHSGVVALLGLVIMIVGFLSKKHNMVNS
jgi:ABC-type antimicrobial peptide transport system permease subunit